MSTCFHTIDELEAGILMFLGGYPNACEPSELLGIGPDEVEQWSDEQQRRYAVAVERVESRIYGRLHALERKGVTPA